MEYSSFDSSDMAEWVVHK